MKITLKLYASFGCFLPPGSNRNTIELNLDSRRSIHQVLDSYGVPLKEAHLVVVNGVFVCESERDSYQLNEGDVLAVWPAVAGG
ncbi:MoaD/ThiS family protein [Aestuariirhabdus sp. Z084]|uniref:sulfur carrier protein ThiS n=1 Tax=Aestuariirhabdus haliotis TaxID=2918751 RepID=UPI00201B37AB|nr:MoaD/ThiS family protein [Aestuariirhabdus haliotis]MCL6414868.1 MoaD/ThiS family protein [Aestuariirhabdus haliotis]MCL6418800.1 MoaD/ThiS family protein [Aestuariirhabdus haliotis]